MKTSEVDATSEVRKNLAGRGQVVGHVGERLVGVGADRGDGGDAHHDDQGEHDGVFDRGRAVFPLQELDDALQHLEHLFASSKKKQMVINPRESVCYDPPTAEFNAALLNVLLAPPPTAVMAVMHTTIIKASITAYS